MNLSKSIFTEDLGLCMHVVTGQFRQTVPFFGALLRWSLLETKHHLKTHTPSLINELT